MNQKLIEYMVSNPSEMQMGILKYLYSSMLKQLDALKQYKNDEINKLQNFYNNETDQDIQSIYDNRVLLKEEIDLISQNLYLLENCLFKNWTIYADLSETNICPICKRTMPLHSLHFVLFDSSKSNIIGRDYTKSCFCDTCKRRYIPQSSYKELINLYDIRNTNIVINKTYCIPESDIYTIIVLDNTKPCTSKGHNTKDIVSKFPSINKEGELVYINLPASYCFDCNRFTVLKEDFNSVQERILCNIIDDTTESKNSNKDEIEIEQQKSLLFNYGYNVQTKKNLSDIQRQTILSSIIEAKIMDRRDIVNHLTTLIERGSKIPNWKAATSKWKQDRDFVSDYKLGDLSSVIFDNVIKKYTYKKS